MRTKARPAPLPAFGQRVSVWCLELGLSSGSSEVKAKTHVIPFLLKSLGPLLSAAEAFLNSVDFGTESGVGANLTAPEHGQLRPEEEGSVMVLETLMLGPGGRSGGHAQGSWTRQFGAEESSPWRQRWMVVKAMSGGGSAQRGREGGRPVGALVRRDEGMAVLPTS